MKDWHIKLILYAASGVGLLVLIVMMTSSPGPEEERQGALLKTLAAETQYPHAKPIRDHLDLDINEANFSAYYTSTQDNFKNVAEFYHQQLTTKGWVTEAPHPTEPKGHKRYRKNGGYQFTIYEGDRHQYDFSVYFIWRRP